MALPVIDLKNFSLDEYERQEIVCQLDRAFSDTGFCYIRNFDIPKRERDAVFQAAKLFHRLPEADKLEISVNSFHRGYIPLATSTIRASTIEAAVLPNRNASFMMMHEVSPEDPRAGQPLQGPNQWPRALQDFELPVRRYHDAVTNLSVRFTRLIAQALDQAEDRLDVYFKQPTSWLRLLYYPAAIPGSDTQNADLQYGSSPHTDHGFITFLAQDDDVPGLEVRLPGDKWVPVPPIENTLVVNVADMLSFWSGGKWPSTPHRVMNNPDKERFSVAFFWDPAMDTIVDCRELGISASKNFEAVNYGKYVLEKLGRNYDYRQ